MNTLDWIYSRCEDSQHIVTPRDVIDMLQFARANQFTMAQQSRTSIKEIMGPTSLKYGYQKMSERKVETYLQAEYPALWTHYISKFKNARTVHTRESLVELLGTADGKVVTTLEEVGFLRFVSTTNHYTVPALYRHGMGLIRGAAGRAQVLAH